MESPSEIPPSAPITLRAEPTGHPVISGESLTIPITIANQSKHEMLLEVAVSNLPSGWEATSTHPFHLLGRAQRAIGLGVHVPAPPEGRPGRYLLRIQARAPDAAEAIAETEALVVVATFKMEGRIGFLMESTAFTVAPGKRVAAVLTLDNMGTQADDFIITVQGIPETWISNPSPVTYMPPRGQKQISLIIAPPRLPESTGGAHSFTLSVSSRQFSDQAASIECTLTIEPFVRFASQLRPYQIEGKSRVAVEVQNRGNTEADFTISLASERNAVRFRPATTFSLRTSAGETVRNEFTARPRWRPLLGGEVAYPYTAEVQAAGAVSQVLHGQVLSRGLIPGWLAASVLILALFGAFFYLYFFRL